MEDVGDTIIEEPVPARVTPQPPVYHFQDAPVPSEPPLTVSVVLPPLQIVVVPVIPVGLDDKVFVTLTVTDL